MTKRTNYIWDGAKLGGLIGGAVGTILTGVSFAIPGGREIIIARMFCSAVAAASNVTTLSGTAVGTLVGAAAGGWKEKCAKVKHHGGKTNKDETNCRSVGA